MIGYKVKPGVGAFIGDKLIYTGEGYAVDHTDGAVYHGYVGMMKRMTGFSIELPKRPHSGSTKMTWRRWAEKCHELIKTLQGL